MRPEIAETEQPDDPSLPMFSIGTVSRHTGVSPPALRMWEERYGVIEPDRDEYGKRLYSRDQIEDLSWLRDAISQGLTAAEAHRMLETRKETGRVPRGKDEDRGGFRQWVLADHAWLTYLCASTVETVSPALLAYFGVPGPGNSPHAESCLFISSLKADRPAWFTGGAHQAAHRHPERLSSGETVSFSLGSEGQQVWETAVPVMIGAKWSATVGLVVMTSDDHCHRELDSMLERILARYEAWKAYARFEALTAPDDDASDHSA